MDLKRTLKEEVERQLRPLREEIRQLRPLRKKVRILCEEIRQLRPLREKVRRLRSGIQKIKKAVNSKFNKTWVPITLKAIYDLGN